MRIRGISWTPSVVLHRSVANLGDPFFQVGCRDDNVRLLRESRDAIGRTAHLVPIPVPIRLLVSVGRRRHHGRMPSAQSPARAGC